MVKAKNLKKNNFTLKQMRFNIQTKSSVPLAFFFGKTWIVYVFCKYIFITARTLFISPGLDNKLWVLRLRKLFKIFEP